MADVRHLASWCSNSPLLIKRMIAGWQWFPQDQRAIRAETGRIKAKIGVA